MTESIFKNWKAFVAIFAGMGLLVMSVGTVLPTVSAGGIPTQACDAGNGDIQHWDKIIFTNSAPITKPDESKIGVGSMLDIKVLDDPADVANLEQKVVDFLNGNGFTRNGGSFNHHHIEVIDVEYAITCVWTPA